MPKLNPNRVPMRRLDPATRVFSFQEVDLGYTEEEMVAEAQRCLLCPRPACVEGCPARNRIPEFIRALQLGDLPAAAQALAERSSFPAICSRVCDHARQCEGSCAVGKRADPVAIGALERYVGDWAREHAFAIPLADAAPRTGRYVAVVGAGPAGLAAAGELARRGHQVDVFDALPVPGGVLAAGIPAFRLPNEVIDWPVQNVKALGVRFYPSTRLGPDFSLDFLFESGYNAVFLAIGASAPTWPGLPGERLPGVWQANDFLARAKLSQYGGLEGHARPQVGRQVVVIGAGNTAMDVAQTARRLGAEEVQVVYRRSAAEVPARHEEVESAEEEGVTFRFLIAPTRFSAGPDGNVEAMECIAMQLGEPGPDGRRKPMPEPGSEFRVPVDTVVLALGFETDPAAVPFIESIGLSRHKQAIVNPETGRTSRTGVWAGGDLVTGADTVVRAMAAGRRAAADIDVFLSAAGEEAGTEREAVMALSASR